MKCRWPQSAEGPVLDLSLGSSQPSGTTPKFSPPPELHWRTAHLEQQVNASPEQLPLPVTSAQPRSSSPSSSQHEEDAPHPDQHGALLEPQRPASPAPGSPDAGTGAAQDSDAGEAAAVLLQLRHAHHQSDAASAPLESEFTPSALALALLQAAPPAIPLRELPEGEGAVDVSARPYLTPVTAGPGMSFRLPGGPQAASVQLFPELPRRPRSQPLRAPGAPSASHLARLAAIAARGLQAASVATRRRATSAPGRAAPERASPPAPALELLAAECASVHAVAFRLDGAGNSQTTELAARAIAAPGLQHTAVPGLAFSGVAVRHSHPGGPAATAEAPPPCAPRGPLQCSNCGTSQTPLWRKDRATGQTVCNACGIYKQTHGCDRPVGSRQAASAPATAQPPADVARASPSHADSAPPTSMRDLRGLPEKTPGIVAAARSAPAGAASLAETATASLSSGVGDVTGARWPLELLGSLSPHRAAQPVAVAVSVGREGSSGGSWVQAPGPDRLLRAAAAGQEQPRLALLPLRPRRDCEPQQPGHALHVAAFAAPREALLPVQAPAPQQDVQRPLFLRLQALGPRAPTDDRHAHTAGFAEQLPNKAGEAGRPALHPRGPTVCVPLPNGRLGCVSLPAKRASQGASSGSGGSSGGSSDAGQSPCQPPQPHLHLQLLRSNAQPASHTHQRTALAHAGFAPPAAACADSDTSAQAPEPAPQQQFHLKLQPLEPSMLPPPLQPSQPCTAQAAHATSPPFLLLKRLGTDAQQLVQVGGALPGNGTSGQQLCDGTAVAMPMPPQGQRAAAASLVDAQLPPANAHPLVLQYAEPADEPSLRHYALQQQQAAGPQARDAGGGAGRTLQPPLDLSRAPGAGLASRRLDEGGTPGAKRAKLEHGAGPRMQAAAATERTGQWEALADRSRGAVVDLRQLPGRQPPPQLQPHEQQPRHGSGTAATGGLALVGLVAGAVGYCPSRPVLALKPLGLRAAVGERGNGRSGLAAPTTTANTDLGIRHDGQNTWLQL